MDLFISIIQYLQAHVSAKTYNKIQNSVKNRSEKPMINKKWQAHTFLYSFSCFSSIKILKRPQHGMKPARGSGVFHPSSRVASLRRGPYSRCSNSLRGPYTSRLRLYITALVLHFSVRYLTGHCEGLEIVVEEFESRSFFGDGIPALQH